MLARHRKPLARRICLICVKGKKEAVGTSVAQAGMAVTGDVWDGTVRGGLERDLWLIHELMLEGGYGTLHWVVDLQTPVPRWEQHGHLASARHGHATWLLQLLPQPAGVAQKSCGSSRAFELLWI